MPRPQINAKRSALSAHSGFTRLGDGDTRMVVNNSVSVVMATVSLWLQQRENHKTFKSAGTMLNN